METHQKVVGADKVLADLISRRTLVAPPDLLAISPYAAISQLQKGIRRGETTHALSAAATLLATSPERLWRRLGCIAPEDVGLGNIVAVRAVIDLIADLRGRKRYGTDWAIADALVEALARSPKCRAADDLLLVLERSSRWAEAQLDLSRQSDTKLWTG